jgi:hypothetical protein
MLLCSLGSVVLACSGGANTISSGLSTGDPCDTLGATDCGVDSYGRPVVLMCSQSADGELKWGTSVHCDYGCEASACLPEPLPDVEDVGERADLAVPDIGDVKPLKDADGGVDDVGGDGLPDTAEVVCVPKCEGKECGLDGCGGWCGECPDGQVCLGGLGTCCAPDCFGKLCGDNGCQGVCGECAAGYECNTYFQCAPVCAPKCEGKECGPDGCGGSCGECAPGKACGGDGKCSVCIPDCTGKECGSDGCGGQCGGCPFGSVCGPDDTCGPPCTPQCAGKECGPDGCGDDCGTCMPGETCVDGVCAIVCEPQCAGKECGADGCGGTCGKCAPWAWCSAQGKCISDCVPVCTGKVCGSDGCGGSCGTCPNQKLCLPDGSCALTGAPCGAVGGQGWCDTNLLVTCDNGTLHVTDCLTEGKNVVCEFLPAVNGYGCNAHGECVPSCTGKECGSDGCGGSCGQCLYGMQCVDGYCKGEGPCGEITYMGCCNENSAYWCDNGKLWHMDCSTMASPDQQVCGWNPEYQFYDCVGAATQGPEGFPFFCKGACVPNCVNKQCGDDGCGGQCGQCPEGIGCVDFQCKGSGQDCGGYGSDPVCQGDTVVWCEDGQLMFQDCTANGMFWHCGWVGSLFVNSCYKEECVPSCEDKECGDDGCGYVCGYCPVTMMCNDLFQCVYGQGFCGDVDYVGKCEDNSVKWCQNGILQIFSCANLGPEWACGWYEKGGYFWCIPK